MAKSNPLKGIVNNTGARLKVIEKNPENYI